MSPLRRYTAIFLMFIFGYVLTPAALIHAFHGHEDTHCIPGDVAVGNQHVHCRILQIEAQVYTSPEPLLVAEIREIVDPFQLPQHAVPSRALVYYTDLRAPPAV